MAPASISLNFLVNISNKSFWIYYSHRWDFQSVQMTQINEFYQSERRRLMNLYHNSSFRATLFAPCHSIAFSEQILMINICLKWIVFVFDRLYVLEDARYLINLEFLRAREKMMCDKSILHNQTAFDFVKILENNKVIQ